MMNSDELFEQWKQYRNETDVPASFADGVVDRLNNQLSGQLSGRQRRREKLMLVAASVMAGAVCLFRMACVVGLFFLPNRGGFFMNDSYNNSLNKPQSHGLLPYCPWFRRAWGTSILAISCVASHYSAVRCCRAVHCRPWRLCRHPQRFSF